MSRVLVVDDEFLIRCRRNAWQLPDSNDLGLLAKVRSLAPASAVVMMTAFGTPDVTAGTLQLGACKVLSKPFNMHDLEDIVQRYASPAF